MKAPVDAMCLGCGLRIPKGSDAILDTITRVEGYTLSAFRHPQCRNLPAHVEVSALDEMLGKLHVPRDSSRDAGGD